MAEATAHRHAKSFLLRARVVVPISGPPIPNGAVRIRGNRIGEVGRWRDLAADGAAPVQDLGEVALLPGLVNAHCHLDYTSMAGMFSPPKRFTDWIKQVTAAKAEWGYSDFAESWLNGARMLLHAGVTAVGDIETTPELLPEVWEATPLRILSFLEMTGVKSRRQPRTILKAAVERINQLGNPRCFAGLSPHAPYSTLPELLRLSAETARQRRWRLCTHVAESAQEFEMFVHGRGEMFDWLRRSERDMSDCGLGSPVDHLRRHGMLDHRLLAVHVNYLAPADAALLAEHQVNVVHCPRSHDYFQHDPFPFEKLAAAGVNICLGTDSLASVRKERRRMPQLDLFEEMRSFSREHPRVPPEAVLQMATQNGATALGLKGAVGELSPRAFADVIAVPFTGTATEVYAGLLRHEGPVHASMIDGHWALAAPAVEATLAASLQSA